MAQEFRKVFSDEPVTPGETLEIKPMPARFSFPPETLGGDTSSCRPFVNNSLNSRLSQALPIGDWTIACSADLEPGSRPQHILHGANRIIVQGDGPWKLFDHDCRLLAKGYLDGSDVYLDAAHNLFFFSDAAGMIEARSLESGNRTFSASTLFGISYYRSFIARRAEKLLVVSIEREIDQDAEEKPDESTVEVIKFEEPQIIDQDGILRSAEAAGELIRDTIVLRSAMYDETLVVATDNQICLIDLDLNIKSVLNGEFTPFVMSVNNTGIIFLVLLDEGVTKLRAIKPNGERIYSIQLSEEMLNLTYPPIVAYDNRVFLVKNNYLMAFAPNGHYLWEYKSQSRIAGAVVTADNQLLISDGAELGVFQANGIYRTLYEFENETLQTPPTLTGNGDLVVATDNKIYRLARREN